MSEQPKKRYCVRVAKRMQYGYRESLNWNAVSLPYTFGDRKSAEEFAAILLRAPEVDALAIVEFFDGEQPPQLAW